MNLSEIRRTIGRARNFIREASRYPSKTNSYGKGCAAEAERLIDCIAAFGLSVIAADLSAELAEVSA